MLRRISSVSLWVLATAMISGVAAADSDTVASDGLSSSLIRETYEDVTDSVCLLSYSLEITNPNTGRTNKRDANAIGVIVSDDGLVLAHGHLQLENREPLNVRVTINLLGERRQYPAKLLKKPDDINVCFLRIQFRSAPKPDLTPIRFHSRNELSIGEPVLAFGILSESLDHVPSSLGRRVGAILEEPRTTYCVNESVPFGFVGGPVIDTEGRAVGVIGFDLSANEGGEVYTRSGHPLIYYSDLFQKYIDTPPSAESVEIDQDDAWLGVLSQPLTDDLAEYWDLPDDGGIVVSTVVPDSPADHAGLRMGDVIIRFAGQPVRAKRDRDIAAFTRLVRETPPGEDVEVELYRDGALTTINLALSDRPITARDAREFKDDVFGMTVREITRDVRIMLNLPADVQGVIVRKVESGSAANLAGIRPNAIVLAMNGMPVPNIDQYVAVVEQLSIAEPNEIAVLCRVGPRTGFFRMEPRWDE